MSVKRNIRHSRCGSVGCPGQSPDVSGCRPQEWVRERFAELRPNGTKAAWAVPDGQLACTHDYIEISDMSAKPGAYGGPRERREHDLKCTADCRPTGA